MYNKNRKIKYSVKKIALVNNEHEQFLWAKPAFKTESGGFPNTMSVTFIRKKRKKTEEEHAHQLKSTILERKKNCIC